MIMYGHHESGHSFKVRSFLQLSNTPHEYRWVDLTQPRKQRRSDFVAHSRFGEVPVLLDGGKTLCQSNAILMYLALKQQQFCGKPNDWTQIIEWLSWEANRIGFSLPNLRFALRWSPQPPEVLNYLHTRLLADLETLNHFLAHEKFLVSDELSIADISCSAYLYWLSHVQIPLEDYPHIKRWLEQISQHNNWQHPDTALKQA